MQIRLVIVKSVRLLIKAILSKPLRFSVALLLKAGDEHNDFCDQQQTIIKHRCVTYLYLPCVLIFFLKTIEHG
jgi:hypothetical protein